MDDWTSSFPCAVRVTVTKVRTGGSDEDFAIFEDAVAVVVEMTNVGGGEKELVKDSVAVAMLVLTADKDEIVGTAVELESLRIMKDTAETSIVGFG